MENMGVFPVKIDSLKARFKPFSGGYSSVLIFQSGREDTVANLVAKWLFLRNPRR